MSERVTDPQVVCPFVAYDDDRDFRSPVPDHRHRCFAESPAAPRALAHQAAYCLSAAFPGCPTFLDWARREAAPPKPEPAVRSLRETPATPRGAVPPAAVPAVPARPAAGTGRPGEPGWAAPPPWGMAAGAVVVGGTAGAEAGAEVGGEAEPAVPGEEADAGAPGAATSGPDRAAAELAGYAGEAEQPLSGPEEGAGAPAFLATRGRRSAPPPLPPEDEEPWSSEAGAAPEAPRRPVAEPRRMPVGYAPVAPSKERRVAGSHRGRVDADAPSWEQPRRLEEYPTLKARGGGIPRPALYAVIVLLVGIGLFATPFLLRGLGGGGEAASPTPVPTASTAPTAVPTPTPVPTPAQVVHVVKSGDTLSKIAAQYGVTVDQILAANPQIKNPNRIAVGDEIVIPQPPPTEIVDGEVTPTP